MIDLDNLDVLEDDFLRSHNWRTEYHTDEEGITFSRRRQWIKEFKTEPSRAKVIKSGPKIEVYIFQKPVFLKAKNSNKWSFRTGRRKNSDKVADYDRHDENRNLSSRKAKFRLMRLVATNFTGKQSKFLTLTFSDNAEVYNKKEGRNWNFKFHQEIIKVSKEYKEELNGIVKRCTRSIEESFDYRKLEHTNKVFKTFIQRMRAEYGDFKYVAVPEFQDSNGRGAVHYHMVADLPYIKIKELSEEKWGWGYVLITDIKHVDNVGAYITKYMTQDINDYRLEGKKAYLGSQNLDKPEEKNSYDAYAEISKIKWDKKVPIYEDEYGDEESYVGKIKFMEYHDNVNTIVQVEARKKRISINRQRKNPLNNVQ